jgi:hypothetical protein
VAVAVTLGTVGCSNPEIERQNAIAKAQEHCAAEGKRFLLDNVEQTGYTGDHWFSKPDRYTTVSGHCLFPNDPRLAQSPLPK